MGEKYGDVRKGGTEGDTAGMKQSNLKNKSVAQILVDHFNNSDLQSDLQNDKIPVSQMNASVNC